MTTELSGCSGGSQSPAHEKIRGETITVVMPAPPPPKKLLDRFTAQTGVTVKWNNVDFDSITTKVAAGGAARTYFGDVTYFNFLNGPQYAKLKWFLPLDTLLDPGVTKDTLGKSAFTYDKKLYGVPWDASVGVTTLNKSMFAKAGITSLPTTMDDYTADLVKIKRAGIVKYPLSMPFSAAEGLTVYWIQTTVAFGGASIFDKHGKEQFSSPSSPGYKAAQWMISALKTGLVSPGAVNDGDSQAQGLQAQGLSASSLVDYAGNVSSLYDDPKQSKVVGQVVYLPVPGAHGPVRSINLSDGIGVPAFAKHPAAAAKFVSWLIDGKNQIKFGGAGASDEVWSAQYLPSNYPALTTLNAKGKVGDGAVLLNILKNHSQPYFPYGTPEWYPAFSHAVQTSLHAAATGTMTVPDAIKAMAAAATH
ncbi:extracellular solute-binding protein [Amnibacterium sp. CER49]|uniref:extracellular solute-binding protein n=1 Tax=Amnibacterium sp. CER49 TaxID=3039161 RepID=UPI0024499125|nr:extracellular solute-binding protein [Amnibacterium sp. CER49]MDH2443215.1 extracellular solute-binding protein [Amnibacterium sp. CER49]